MTQPITYAWTTRHLPLFGGTEGEDPVLHCRNFHHVCSIIRPEDERLEEFKLKCFKFSLTDFATIWYYTSTAWNAERFMDISVPFLREFSPPSLRQKTRERIMNLQQSRDETLGEYYANYDAIISSCPHHGFTKKVLLQKFLRGMKADDLTRLNEAMRSSARKFTIADVWNLINNLAATIQQIPQADGGIQMQEAGPETDEEDTPEPSKVSDIESFGSNEPSWEQNAVSAMDEVQNTTSMLPEPYPAFFTQASETIYNQVPTDGHDEAGPSLKMRPSQLFPSINKQIAENYAIQEEAEKQMGKGPEQKDSYIEHAFAMTGQGSPKQEKTQFKKLIVKGPSPSQRRWKEIPSELDPNPSSAKKSGRLTAIIKVGGIKKYDLSHPWDPNQ
ncbi:unnamed protein product [Rhodiola kirilowii]